MALQQSHRPELQSAPSGGSRQRAAADDSEGREGAADPGTQASTHQDEALAAEASAGEPTARPVLQGT